MTDSPKPKRRWFQFSLRTLLLLTAASAVLLGLWAIYVEPYRAQSRAALQSPSRPYSLASRSTTFGVALGHSMPPNGKQCNERRLCVSRQRRPARCGTSDLG